MNWLSGDWDLFAYTVFLKGTTLILKGSLLAAIEPISAVFFAFSIYE